MRAAQFSRFGGPEVLEIVDLPEPHAGAGQVRIRVEAAGVNASDWKKRAGEMDPELPQTLGYEAAGVVDEVGEGVTGTSTGDRVFGVSGSGATQAEYAVMDQWAPIPDGLDVAQAASLPVAVGTAARGLDDLDVERGALVLISGASGSVGSAAVQLGVARGLRIIGTGSARNHEHLRSMGAEPVAYGDGMVARVRELAPDGVDAALDVAGSGVLPELIELSGGPEHVVTLADFAGAEKYGVRFSRGDRRRHENPLEELMPLLEQGRFRLPEVHAFPLEQIADVHRAGETGRLTGKTVVRP